MYPTYDYTHCIVDALEHVDYSICTLEFETRRESYYWVLDALDLYRPKVFEMSRLNVSHVVLSKRKLTKLVDTGKVRGWDDPRMPTISGLRRSCRMTRRWLDCNLEVSGRRALISASSSVNHHIYECETLPFTMGLGVVIHPKALCIE